VDNIEKNLYDFYRVLAEVKNISLVKKEDFELIQAKNNLWPQLIFNLNQQKNQNEIIPEISRYLADYKLSPSIVAPDEYISKNHSELLKASSLIPVKVLMGMNTSKGSKENIKMPADCEICELKNKTQLSDFSMLIQREFFSSKKDFGEEILLELKDSEEVTMTGLYKDSTLVSSMLVFIKDNIAGLYFIGTKKENQKKGYASLLIRSGLNQLFKTGIKEVVLHANHNSFALYQKIGFEVQNKFIVYKKV